jgi:hypothetical protein
VGSDPYRISRSASTISSTNRRSVDPFNCSPVRPLICARPRNHSPVDSTESPRIRRTCCSSQTTLLTLPRQQTRSPACDRARSDRVVGRGAWVTLRVVETWAPGSALGSVCVSVGVGVGVAGKNVICIDSKSSHIKWTTLRCRAAPQNATWQPLTCPLTLLHQDDSAFSLTIASTLDRSSTARLPRSSYRRRVVVQTSQSPRSTEVTLARPNGSVVSSVSMCSQSTRWRAVQVSGDIPLAHAVSSRSCHSRRYTCRPRKRYRTLGGDSLGWSDT